MLNTFPQLLVLGFFAPTLLRIAAACVFAMLAYKHWHNVEHIAQTRFPLVGSGAWIPWVAVIVEGIVALCLLLGYHTQISAIVGLLAALKYAFWAGKYPSYFVLSRTAALLLAVVCLSLMLSGAGALAFDLPL